METPKETFNYVGADTCGCVVAICSDANPNPHQSEKAWRKIVADMIGEMIQEGYTVTRLPKEEAHRLMRLECTHAEPTENVSMPLFADAA